MERQRGWRRQLVPGDGPLSGVPPMLAFLAVAAIFAAGVVVGGVLGAALLAVLVLLVGSLLAVTWRRLAPAERALRLLVLLVLVAVAVSLLD